MTVGAKDRINHLKVTLTPDDLYTMEFSRFSPSKLDFTPVTKFEGVFAEDLQRLFTDATGFYTTL